MNVITNTSPAIRFLLVSSQDFVTAAADAQEIEVAVLPIGSTAWEVLNITPTNCGRGWYEITLPVAYTQEEGTLIIEAQGLDTGPWRDMISVWEPASYQIVMGFKPIRAGAST